MTTSLLQRPGREDLLLDATPEQVNALHRFVSHEVAPLPEDLRDNPIFRRTLGEAAVRMGESMLKDIENEKLADQVEKRGLDTLTRDLDIFNRHGFEDVMNRRDELFESNRVVDTISKPTGTLVVYIDGDEFGAINKAFGEDIGDKAIHKIASTICDNVRDEDIVCRRGGDEFVVIADIVGVDKDVAARKADEIVVRMQKALEAINDDETGLKSASLGFRYLEGANDSTSITEAIRQADIAMRANKRARKEKIVYN